jgi:antitoxin (DNA-binding transcriptional repressor) of toxin-antitoxin stability system
MGEIMSSDHISKSKFKARALEFFRQVETSGQSVIVTDHGKPTLEIRPYQASDRQALEILRGSVLRFDAPTEPVGVDDWAAAQ